jgi:hypothetical protein
VRATTGGLLSRISNAILQVARRPYGAQIPVLFGVLGSLVVWGATGSVDAFEFCLFVVSGASVSWECVVLFAQNLASSRPAPERVDAHNWLRGRAVAWSVAAIAAAGGVLTAARLNTTIAPSLVPASDVPLTEIVVLALTIAILAVLTRYSAISSYVESTRMSAELGRVVGEVRDSLAGLQSSIEGLTGEVRRLDAARTPRPRISGSVYHVSSSKTIHTIGWRISVADAMARAVSLTIAADGVPRGPMVIGDMSAGSSREGSLGALFAREYSGTISLAVTYADSIGTPFAESFDFVYRVQTGFWGGIKAVTVSRV